MAAGTVADFIARLEGDDCLPESIVLVDGKDRFACAAGSALSVSATGMLNPVLTRSSQDVQVVFGGFFSRLLK